MARHLELYYSLGFFGLDRNIACLLREKCAPSYARTTSNLIGAPLSYFDEMSAVHIVNLLTLLF